jgi:hypothetical protein
MGQLRIRLTDAPFPFDLVESASVIIDSVTVHIAADEAERSGFVVLSRVQQTHDLLDLQNGVTAVLADSEVPAGKVNQIRLYVSSASLTLTDERTFDLTVPSGAESGIKIFPSPVIRVVGSLTTELLLDFDVSRSFHPTPNAPTKASDIREFAFLPTLRVSNVSETGSLSGTVRSDAGTALNPDDDLPVQDASITASRDGGEVAATSTDEEGRYMLQGLAAGAYTLEATANGFESTALQATVVVGNNVGGNDLLLTPTP